MLTDKLANKTSFIQFLKFCAVGVTNTLVYLGTYYLLLYLGVHYLLANVIGFIISVLNAYYWNHKFVFHDSQVQQMQALGKTYCAYGLTTVLSTFLLYILVAQLGISNKIAPLLTLIITIPLNFLLNKFWAFK